MSHRGKIIKLIIRNEKQKKKNFATYLNPSPSHPKLNGKYQVQNIFILGYQPKGNNNEIRKAFRISIRSVGCINYVAEYTVYVHTKVA